MSVKSSLVGALCLAAAACGPKPIAGAPKALGENLVAVEVNGGTPTFSWKPCTAFSVKNCAPGEIKVTSILIMPADCTTTGENSGERPAMWQVVAAPGHPIPSPLTYGASVEQAVVGAGPTQLQGGCSYAVSIGVANESQSGATISKSFKL